MIIGRNLFLATGLIIVDIKLRVINTDESEPFFFFFVFTSSHFANDILINKSVSIQT